MSGTRTEHGWLTDAIEPALIVEQRAKGWTDFHPETYCHRCGRLNLPSWYVASALWNVAVPSVTAILCPQCFAVAYREATGLNPTWELLADPETLPGEIRSEAQTWLIVQRERAIALARTLGEALAAVAQHEVSAFGMTIAEADPIVRAALSEFRSAVGEEPT